MLNLVSLFEFCFWSNVVFDVGICLVLIFVFVLVWVLTWGLIFFIDVDVHGCGDGGGDIDFVVGFDVEFVLTFDFDLGFRF